MRSLCKTWTEGSPAVFAVLDGLGAWTGDNQLCMTQEGHTPFIGAWTTVTNWTNEGSPYLWWTGPDQATILQAVVNWGLSAHLIGGHDQGGSHRRQPGLRPGGPRHYLLPDLRNAGVDPIVKTIDADPNDTATTGTQSPLVIQQLRSAGVTSVIPLMPFNVFFPVLQAETAQQYFPRLLLSDYEGSILSSLGLLPIPYAKALDGQEGVTTETLGGIDDPRPQSQGGYDTGRPPVLDGLAQGLSAGATREHERLHRGAGTHRRLVPGHPSLRRPRPKPPGPTSTGAPSSPPCPGSANFPGTWSPVLSYGPNKRYGPTEYQVVKLHINSPPSSLCKTGRGPAPAGHVLGHASSPGSRCRPADGSTTGSGFGNTRGNSRPSCPLDGPSGSVRLRSKSRPYGSP